jgi:hypothetical protein
MFISASQRQQGLTVTHPQRNFKTLSQREPNAWRKGPFCARPSSTTLESGSAQVPFVKERHLTGQVLILERIESAAGQPVAALSQRSAG